MRLPKGNFHRKSPQYIFRAAAYTSRKQAGKSSLPQSRLRNEKEIQHVRIQSSDLVVVLAEKIIVVSKGFEKQ